MALEFPDDPIRQRFSDQEQRDIRARLRDGRDIPYSDLRDYARLLVEGERALAKELAAALELEHRAHAHRRLCGACDKESLNNGAAGCYRWYALMEGYSSGEALAKLREKEERDAG